MVFDKVSRSSLILPKIAETSDSNRLAAFYEVPSQLRGSVPWYVALSLIIFAGIENSDLDGQHCCRLAKQVFFTRRFTMGRSVTNSKQVAALFFEDDSQNANDPPVQGLGDKTEGIKTIVMAHASSSTLVNVRGLTFPSKTHEIQHNAPNG